MADMLARRLGLGMFSRVHHHHRHHYHTITMVHHVVCAPHQVLEETSERRSSLESCTSNASRRYSLFPVSALFSRTKLFHELLHLPRMEGRGVGRRYLGTLFTLPVRPGRSPCTVVHARYLVYLYLYSRRIYVRKHAHLAGPLCTCCLIRTHSLLSSNIASAK